jgi:hypothetical protein
MGFCLSLCRRDNERPDPENRFPILEIRQKSDSDSDPALKAKASAPSGSRDVVPLLDGPTLLSFRQMQLSSDSSADEERERIAKLLHPTEGSDGVDPSTLKPKRQIDSSSRTFPNVPADYNANADSSDEAGTKV